MLMLTPAELVALLETGSGWFDGEAVDELTHALQTAERARAAGADDELMTAAALHDCGRLPGIADRYPGWTHEAAGAHLCSGTFGARVAWLIGAHVPAKRYLVATDPAYTAGLSPTSARTLEAQGGPMRGDELTVFAAHPWAADAAALRRWDDLAKVPGAPASTLDNLLPVFERAAALRSAPADA
jgi:predicted HD phosphohydrolase